MDYKEFVEEVLKELKERHGGRMEIEASRIKKNNGAGYDGLIFRSADKGDVTAVPVLRLEPLYEAYIKGEMDAAGCAGALWEDHERNREPEDLKEAVEDICRWDLAKRMVYPVLLSAEWNRELLSGLAAVPVLDLAVVFIVRRKMPGEGYRTIKVTKRMLEGYGVSSQVLYETALKNMENDGYQFWNMDTFLGDMLKLEEIEGMKADIPRKKELYVLTNTSQLYGAAGILNKKLIREFAGDRNFYILPSSLHETIFVQASADNNIFELDRMVREINGMAVEREERLSDHCYYYDGVADEIRMEP